MICTFDISYASELLPYRKQKQHLSTCDDCNTASVDGPGEVHSIAVYRTSCLLPFGASPAGTVGECPRPAMKNVSWNVMKATREERASKKLQRDNGGRRRGEATADAADTTDADDDDVSFNAHSQS